jgi:hypothetical protein
MRIAKAVSGCAVVPELEAWAEATEERISRKRIEALMPQRWLL